MKGFCAVRLKVAPSCNTGYSKFNRVLAKGL